MLEKLYTGLFTAGLGIAVVFLALILLIGFIYLFNFIMTNVNKNENKKVSQETTANEILSNNVSDVIPNHIVIAITAAINMMYEKEEIASEFNIKKIKRV